MSASLKRRAIALVEQQHPCGVTALIATLALHCSWATASKTLARLYWAGVINRHKDGRHFRYTRRGTNP